MQRGQIFQASGSWYVRYYAKPGPHGRVTKRLGRVSVYPSRESVEPLAEEVLAPFQYSGRSLGRFIEGLYLPHVESRLRPSTVKSYRDMWNGISHHCGEWTIRDARTFQIQRVLEHVARDRGLSKSSLQHLKAFLSGVFRFASQQGFYDGANPVTAVSIPNAPGPIETHAYDLEEIEATVKVLPELAATVVLVAAFTGLRVGEIQGMRWENLEPGEPFASYSVTQSIWRGRAVPPKTVKSKAPTPIIPPLEERLEAHRSLCSSPTSGPIFASSNGMPVDLKWLHQGTIKPILKREAITWYGWHAFRRGIASNLFELGCDDLTVQRVLRHSKVQVTREHYLKVRDAKVEDAMQKLSLATRHIFTH
jgi:integrase